MRSSQTPGEEDANERLANRTDSEKGRAPLGGAGAKPAPNGTGAASSQLRTTKMTETGTTTKTTITTTTESNENDDGKSSDKQLLDAECERLLRNTKRQVKQMMEEAVTKKFIHEESSSIISLCVAIDACLSHQLKRRALGLFKTNSSTALVRKIAKLCPEAQATISMVEEEERRQQEELKRQKKQQQQQAAANQARQKQQQQQQHQSTDGSGSRQRGAPNTGSFATQQHGSPVKQVASNLSVHRRNMWIKCALIEKRLVPIVEHLAANASKYYEPEALMSNYVSAQLLCSLLVGPCALEFSRSKTNDFYQFEEPSADELLKRHNLSNPIACLCSSSVSSLASHTSAHPSSSLRRFHGGSLNYRPPTKTMSTHHQHDDIHQHVSRSLSTSTTGGSAKLFRHHHPQNRNRLSADKDSSQSCTDGASGSLQQPEAAATSVTNTNTKTHTVGRLSRRRPSTASQSSLHELIQEEDYHHLRHASSPSSGSPLVRNSSGGSCGGAGSGASGGGGVSRRRRPLALRTNMKTGALVTECHHSACQEISEHQQTRGYSFTCALNPNGNQPQQSITAGRNLCNISSPLSQQRQESMGTQGLGGAGSGTSGGGGSSSADQQQQQQPGGAFNGGLQSQFNNANNNLDSTWPAWSPRMLHETLHQNSKSSLLYAKNNILLETHTHGTVAGYLSLHQTSAPDLIIKWIPNQLINGGHTQTQDTALCGNCRHQQVSSGDPAVQQTAKRHFQKNGTASATTSGPVVAEKSPEIGVATNRRLPGKRSASSNTAPTGEKCGVSEEAARSHSLTTSDALQQQQQQRKSKQANQSTTCHQDLSAIDQPHQQQDGLAGNLSRAIGSSYLDLVINLSVSRIVLLNCHFNGVPTSEFFTTPTEHFSPSSCANSGAGEQLDGDSGSGSGRGSDVGLNSDLEETLILVEADGVQRAPFRFPKGGLRWFLSCLENGLGPDRYLEPAIRPDNDEDDETTGGSSSGNTIEHSKRFADPLQMLHSPAGWMMANHNNGSDSPSTASEPAPGNNNSRLEVLLRRLPSLRRSQPNTKATVNSDNNKTRSVDITPSAAGSAGPPPTLEGGGPNQPHSSELNRGESPTPPSAGGTGNDLRETLSTQWKRPHYRPRNYVYRIVNVHHQFDWAQQTPPLSALSVDLGINGRPHANKRRQQQQHQMLSNDSPGVGQRFSWSLSKLARFSSRTNSTSSSSAGGGGGAGNGLAPANSTETTTGQSKSALGSLTSLLYLSYNKTTLDSVGSLDSSNQQATDLNNNSTDTGLASAMKRDSSSELIRIEAKLNDLKKSSTEELMVLRNQSIQTLCESMRKQILARAFYGWLVYCRRMKIVRTHLMGLINESRLRALNRTRGVAKSDEDEREIVEGLTRDDDVIIAEDEEELMEEARAFGLTWIRWRELVQAGSVAADQQGELSAASKRELARRVNLLVYYGGIEDDQLRAEVWPYLLGHYEFSDSPETRRKRDETCRSAFESSARDWIKIERVIKERDNQILEANMAKVARRQQRERLMAAGGGGEEPASPEQAANGFSSLTSETTDSTEMLREDEDEAQQDDDDDQDDDVQDDVDRNEQGQKGEDSTVREPGELKEEDDRGDDKREESSICQDTTTATTTTTTTITETDDRKETDDKTGDHDIERQEEIGARGKQRINKSSSSTTAAATKARAKRQRRMRRRFRLESTGSVGSDASITDQFGNNIHRIDKDVQRCDRNFWYFKNVDNLNKLRKIMCSYVWQHLDVGYVQGMCDLAAPLLVIFDHDELMAFNCFSQLMKRMVANFPHGSAMDQHFEHLKYLMQVLDPKLFEILQNNGDYTHFYFCYRWLLLDFKRELAYEDVYRVWEAIWSARVVATEHFVVFLALAMVRFYRDIIIENNMDFTDTIKFFNEMAERHDARKIIALAQDCVSELESLIES